MKKSKQKSKGTARPPKHQQYGKHLSTYSKDSMTQYFQNIIALVSRIQKQSIGTTTSDAAAEVKSPTASFSKLRIHEQSNGTTTSEEADEYKSTTTTDTRII